MSSILVPKFDAPHLGLDDLKHLMRAVNETTERLEGTHLALQQEVARLQGELAEANAQLRRSRALAALGEMAAGIAHEVRNPLASIALYAQMLGEDLADRPPQAELCSKVARAVDRLDAIVRDVLSFARDQRLSTRPCSARQLLDQALESCGSALAAAEVTVEAPSPDEPAVEFEADTGLLVQALANVIRNAAEAMAEAGSPQRSVRLTASRQVRRAPQGGRSGRSAGHRKAAGPSASYWRSTTPGRASTPMFWKGCSTRFLPRAKPAPAWAWPSCTGSSMPTADTCPWPTAPTAARPLSCVFRLVPWGLVTETAHRRSKE
jgi:signal transduction histidine kinase